MTVREALRWGTTRLQAAGVEAAARESRLLLAAALGLDGAGLISALEREMDPAPFAAMLARRADREPLAYILGWTEFWSLRLAVSRATLIPRPDSETLIEAALAARPDGVSRILDLGTGTGCLLLAALSEYRGAWGVGCDLVPDAARLARDNARSLGMAARTAFYCGRWADALDARFDLVLSNPPYVESGDIAGLMPEVARFEPGTALDGGADGLSAYRTITAALPSLLAPGGLAVLEVGAGQFAPVADMVGFGRVSARPDLAGVPRAVVIDLR